MNAQDKAEALQWIARILHLTRPTAELDNLRALIERQPDDTDGQMWRFCVEHASFPEGRGLACARKWSLSVYVGGWPFSYDTPAEAVQAAMAAMKEKA